MWDQTLEPSVCWMDFLAFYSYSVEEVEGTSPEERIPRGSSEFLPVEGVQAYSKQIPGVGDAERSKD